MYFRDFFHYYAFENGVIYADKERNPGEKPLLVYSIALSPEEQRVILDKHGELVRRIKARGLELSLAHAEK